MTVYIEYAVIDNLVFDYLLLKVAMKTGRVKFIEIQLAAAAAVGTFFALFFPLMNVGGAAGFIFKIIAGEIMVLAAGKYKDVYSYVRTFLFFLLYTFAVGGAMVGTCYLLGLKFDSEAGLAMFSGAGDIAFGVIVFSGYCFSELAFILFGKARKTYDSGGFLREITVSDGGEGVMLEGIVDTGNSLYDNRTGKPVSVMSRSVADKLILGGVFKMKGAHYVPYSTVKGRGKILVFEIERLVIYCGENRNIIDNAMIGVSPEGEGFQTDVILHAGLLTGGGKI